MRVNDYVRTKYGIALIKNIRNDIRRINLKTNEIYIDKEYELDVCIIPDDEGNSRFCGSEDIIKSSPNITDLIEVGDYVNGSKVQEIGEGCVEVEEYSGLNNDIPCVVKADEIKSIVTKEQFESMEYEVK